MPDRPSPSVSSRKQPRQARSTALVDAILEAAVQVLAEEGAARFTSARVAERAGVSVGSLYQYFPNKAAILFRLQSREWHDTTTMLRGILEDTGSSPAERLRRMVHAFLRSECDEAAVRGALSDAAPLYREAPEARAARAPGERMLDMFLRAALPGVDATSLEIPSDLIGATLAAVGKHVSGQERDPDAVTAFADAMADMICAYLERLEALAPVGSAPRPI